MSKPLLSVENVSKRFCRSLKRSLWYGVKDIAGDLIGLRPENGRQLRPDEFLAVDDVSFDVSPGESLALIGRNGAGKSTLLKMINGLFRPDTGQITVNGRLAALIELGAGFNPILSGRENIYVNAAVLGMTKRDVDKRLDAIVEFAELSTFIDMPLKNYSSGMKVRLGFAVASQLEPEILLIDEVLAVGDAAFRSKCYRRLTELKNNGTAFILVSHNPMMLHAACSRGIVLRNGVQQADEPISKALTTYEMIYAQAPTESVTISSNGNDGVRIVDVSFQEMGIEPKTDLRTGRPGLVKVDCFATESCDDASVTVLLRETTHMGGNDIVVRSADHGNRVRIQPGHFSFEFKLAPVILAPGSYTAKVNINSGSNLNVVDMAENVPFQVLQSGSIDLPTMFQPCEVLFHHHASEQYGLRNVG